MFQTTWKLIFSDHVKFHLTYPSNVGKPYTT